MNRDSNMRSRAIPPLLKDLNERAALDAIRAGAPISRAEISRRSGISKPTVSLALQSLLDAGLVREVAHDPAGPSYGALFFEPVPDVALVLGLDLGARFLRGAICDLSGRIRARQDVALGGTAAETVIETVATLKTSLIDASGLPAALLDDVVIGVPGVIDPRDESIHLATNMPDLEGGEFGAELRRRLELPVTLENDINLAALGERWRGVARGVDDFVFLSIGTGMGAGVVLHGELHRGHNRAAGELDYALVGRTEELSPCAGALVALAARLAREGGLETTLAEPYEARDVFTAARAGDELAHTVVSEIARRIALHVTPVAAVADVRLVVLGGGLGANGDLLLQPIRKLLAEWLPYPPHIEVSSLGDAAVLTGALAVGRRSALDSVFVNRKTIARS
jgi:predicted NBD/HSP70 family sugar kinase